MLGLGATEMLVLLLIGAMALVVPVTVLIVVLVVNARKKGPPKDEG